MPLASNQRMNFTQAISLLLFVASMAATLMTGPWLWMSRVGWIFLAIFFALDKHYAIYAIFYFASFFHASGLLPNDLFSLKYFHIAVFLTMFIQLIRSDLLSTFRLGLKYSHWLYPVFAIIVIAFLSAKLHHSGIKAYRVAANWGLVLVMFIYIVGLVGDDRKLLYNGILFFLFGIASQIGIGFWDMCRGWGLFQGGDRWVEQWIHQDNRWTDMQLLHNNHLGMLAGGSFFYAFSFTLFSRRAIHRWLSMAMSFILLGGVIFCCSRTVWGSFFLCSLLYLFMFSPRNVAPPLAVLYLRRLAIVLVFLFAVLVFAIIMIQFVSYLTIRFNSIMWLFHGYYWRYTVADSNFGFFGILRLKQFYEINEIMSRHFFFGIGLTTEVFGFHCLYFTILGASGFVGLMFFALFCRNFLNRYLRSINENRDQRQVILQIGGFCAVVMWLSSSFMETMFLHFFVWLHVAVGMLFFLPAQNETVSQKPLTQPRLLEPKTKLEYASAN